METREPVNILMVDDQPSKLLTYRAILKDLGENLVSANSGREALDHLLKTEFAVILVDVYMPEQDGFELVEMIRQHPRFQKIPVIFISAFQLTDIEKTKGYTSGAVDFVSVPVVPEVLRAKVAVFADLYRKTRDLARFNQDLESIVSTRTEELEQTQAALLEADRRKDEFLAILAHELRNPLAPMQSSVELLRLAQSEDAQISDVCNTLQRQLKLMTHLIDDLMDMSRITRDNLELRKGEHNLRTLVEHAIEIMQSRIDEHRHSVTISLPPPDVIVHVDGIRVSQVLANLLSNACKYTPDEGKIRVEVELEGGQIVMRVTDNGIGIEQADLDRIFQSFYQVDRESMRSYGGLGVGLSLTKKIVELHDGKIEAVSAGKNKGTTFTVRIPAGTDHADDPKSKSGVKNSAPEAQNLKLLVVDDNRDAAITLTKLLEFLGHQVATAFDGQQACEMVDSVNPDMIFMDIGMPVMNGLQAAKEIRSKPSGAKITLVALTGWGQDKDLRETEEAGFDRHLVKPVSLSDLQAILEFKRKLDADPERVYPLAE